MRIGFKHLKEARVTSYYPMVDSIPMYDLNQDYQASNLGSQLMPINLNTRCKSSLKVINPKGEPVLFIQ